MWCTRGEWEAWCGVDECAKERGFLEVHTRDAWCVHVGVWRGARCGSYSTSTRPFMERVTLMARMCDLLWLAQHLWRARGDGGGDNALFFKILSFFSFFFELFYFPFQFFDLLWFFCIFLFYLFLVMATPFCPKLPDKIRESVISSILPNMEDTFLTNEDMNRLLAWFSNPPPGSISQKVAESGLLL